MPKKDLSPSPSSSAQTPATAELCPPGLWKTQQQDAAQPTPPAPGSSAAEPAVVLTPVEQAQLHVRVIALENLLIALLACATEQQLQCARERAAFISPRAGATPHALTTHAAAEMLDIVERAIHFRGAPSC